MKLALFVEGHTERSALPSFLKRWLDPQLSHPLAIEPLRFKGAADYLKEFSERTIQALASGRVVAVIGLLDLYGLPLDFPPRLTGDQKYNWAKSKLERQVNDSRFRQHFAVHETEAWLLSDPAVLPVTVRAGIPNNPPESVNFQGPPAVLIRSAYRSAGRKYKKKADGAALFQKLDPERVYERCPHFHALLDDMLSLASLRMP